MARGQPDQPVSTARGTRQLQGTPGAVPDRVAAQRAGEVTRVAPKPDVSRETISLVRGVMRRVRAAQRPMRQNEEVDRALDVSRETFFRESGRPILWRLVRPGERCPAHGGNLTQSFPKEFE